MDALIVDGYNIIGAWSDLRNLRERDLAQARDKLIDYMSEYRAITGFRVIVVFDAHFVKGNEKKIKTRKVEVVFTRENETADECIERLVKKIKNVKNQVYVATSDYTEQRTIFAQGALRKSARELLLEMEEVETDIRKEVKKQKEVVHHSKIPISKDVLEVFERWRRGEK
ncbi:NYN domain-containing protein [Bacillaceae bacterium S4-13-58]